MDNIITAKEVGRYLKLSESTVYKLASSGEIPGQYCPVKNRIKTVGSRNADFPS